VGREKEGGGPVFMQTRAHFTETGPHPFQTTCSKPGGGLREEEEEPDHVFTTSPILTSASGPGCAVMVQYATIPCPVRPPHPLSSSQQPAVGETASFDRNASQ